MPHPPWLEPDPPDVLLHLRAVPGASRDAIAGPLGDRLKVRVGAPPEGGKANAAICALLAKTLGLSARRVTIERGATSREKTVRVAGVEAGDVLQALGG
jgi:uncharacterized protein (TIGR00251 family)